MRVFDQSSVTFWVTGLLIVALGYGVWQASAMIILVLVAIVFALFIESVARWPIKWGMPRMLAIILVFVLFLAVAIGVLTAAIPIFLKELTVLKPLLPGGGEIEKIIKAFNFSDTTASVTQLRNLSGSFANMSGGIKGVLTGTFGSLTNLVLLGMLSLYLALEDRAIERLIRAAVPIKHELYVLSLWNRLRVKVESWFSSQLLLSLVAAVVIYGGLQIIGIPYALVLGLLCGILGLIPFGIIIGFVPALALSFVHGESSLTPIYVVGLFGVMQYLTDYIMQPLLLRRTIGLPPLLVIISLVVSVSIFGFYGFFLAIPAAILLLEIVNDIEQRKISDTILEPEQSDPRDDLLEIGQ